MSIPVLFALKLYRKMLTTVLVASVGLLAGASASLACNGGGGGHGGGTGVFENLRSQQKFRVKKVRRSRSYRHRARRPRRHVRRRTTRSRPVRSSSSASPGAMSRPGWVWVGGGRPGPSGGTQSTGQRPVGAPPEYKWGYRMPDGSFVPSSFGPPAGPRRTVRPTQTYASPGAPGAKTPDAVSPGGGSWRPPDYAAEAKQPQYGHYYPTMAPLTPTQKPTEVSPYAVATVKTGNEMFGVLLNGVPGKPAQTVGFVHSALNAAYNSKGATSNNQKQFDKAVDNGVKSLLELSFGVLGAAAGSIGGPGGSIVGGYVGTKVGDVVHAAATAVGEELSKGGANSAPSSPQGVYTHQYVK